MDEVHKWIKRERYHSVVDAGQSARYSRGELMIEASQHKDSLGVKPLDNVPPVTRQHFSLSKQL